MSQVKVFVKDKQTDGQMSFNVPLFCERRGTKNRQNKNKVKVLTHPWVTDNNCVKYCPDPTWQWEVMAKTWILDMCTLWPWPWRYDLGSRSSLNIPLGHGQQLCKCEILCRSHLAVRSYDPDRNFGYVCTMTLALEVWPCVKVTTHSWVTDNNCVKYYQIQPGSENLWP